MKTRSRFVKFATTLAVLIAIAAVLITNQAQAFRPTAVEFHFGMVGITRGQTVRLNVLNVGREPAKLTINFTDSQGRLIKQSVELVEPAQAVFLDLSPSSADDSAGRFQIHSSIEFSEGVSVDGGTFRHLIPTLEVFDNSTGRTNFTLGACDGSV